MFIISLKLFKRIFSISFDNNDLGKLTIILYTSYYLLLKYILCKICNISLKHINNNRISIFDSKNLLLYFALLVIYNVI